MVAVVVDKLQRALDRRAKLVEKLAQEGTNAYRFFSASEDGIPGWVIECFGDVGFFQYHQGKCELSIADLKIGARWCVDNLKLKQIYLKHFLSDRTSGEMPPDATQPTPFIGQPSEPVVTATENGNPFLIRPYDGLSVGLFVDQRNNRRALGGETKKDWRVLNLFAYTCAFSVYCAKAGATVTSVDISQKYLDWGKENFKANGIASESHRFFCADARYFLKAAIKREEKYEQIILDPPSFARGKRNEPFSVKRNLGDVLNQCGEVLAPDGRLFVSTNFAQWQEADLENVIQKSLGKVEYLSVPAVPEDFGDDSAPIIYRLVRR